MGFALVNGISMKNAPLEQNPLLHEISQNDKGEIGGKGGETWGAGPLRESYF